MTLQTLKTTARVLVWFGPEPLVLSIGNLTRLILVVVAVLVLVLAVAPLAVVPLVVVLELVVLALSQVLALVMLHHLEHPMAEEVATAKARMMKKTRRLHLLRTVLNHLFVMVMFFPVRY